MAKPISRTYSRYSREATRLLGLLLRNARTERGLTVQEVAERAGVSRGLVHRAEAGDMGCSIGAVFEFAAIVGVPLFTPEPPALGTYIAGAEKTLSLLPRAVHHSKKAVKDDF